MSVRWLGLAVACAACFGASAAKADDGRYAILDAAAPPSLPSLTHKTFTYLFEFTGAAIDPNPPKSSTTVGCGGQLAAPCLGNALAWFAHNELEYPLVPRKWYVALSHDIASGSLPGFGDTVFVGSPELDVRGVWSSLLGFSSGGGLGLVAPIPRPLPPARQLELDMLRIVRPWDSAYYADTTLTIRPWLDVRHIVGAAVLQLRQGLDISVFLDQLPPDGGRTELASRTTFFFGYQVTRAANVGVELWEIYHVTDNLPDDKRSAFSISPALRLDLGPVEPALSVLFPVSSPLRGQAASFIAMRLAVAFRFDAAGLGGGPARAANAGPSPAPIARVWSEAPSWIE